MDDSNKSEKLLHDSYENKNKEKDLYRINVNTKIQQFITNESLLSNKICTSKYNYLNALPKILCEQFSKVGNIYFLFLAILQMIPSISQSGGTPTIIMPLIFVVVVNGVKDFVEDYKRKQSDSRENKTKCFSVGGGYESSKIVCWEEIKPGDVIKVYKDEYFPADLVLVYSSNKNGVAYVETKNLDGETNLKYKESVKNSYRLLKNFKTEYEKENVIKKTFGVLQCDKPNAHMYDFEGIYYYESRTSVVNFDGNEFSGEKNYTENAYNIEKNFDRTYSKDGIKEIIQGGDLQEKQLSTNHNQADRRISNLEDVSGYLDKSHTNNFNPQISGHNTITPVPLDYNNLLLRGSSLRNTEFIYGVVVYAGHNTKIMLNSLTARSKQSRVFKIMNSQLKLIIILQLIICVSFGLLYSMDPDPYNKIWYQSEMTPVDVVRNFIFAFFAWLLAISNIVPISLLVTLEMIKFCQAIFISWDHKMFDKLNKRTAIVQSSGLNEELGQIQDIFTDKTGTLTKNVMQFRYMVIGDHIYGSEQRANPEELKIKKVTNVDFHDPSLFEHWNNSSHPNSENINNFIFNLALCHSIIVEKKDYENVYNASSPDELALVNAAKYLGVDFAERTDDNYIIIKYLGNTFRYKLLNIFEFNSDRKRMSVIIKDENNIIKLICKGADSVIKKRLNTFKSNTVEKRVDYYLEEFGRKGLRTLMIAEREITPDEYKAFAKDYYSALTSTTNKKQKLDNCYESLEKELVLLGATAIEDCLQDDLKPTLESFRQIGIKVWMLTGDHPFTAVSIGHSCGLIHKDYTVVIISSPKYEEINRRLIEVIDEEEKTKVCLVITGDALSMIQRPSGIGLKNLFLIAIEKSKCVICSRVSPKQKADLILMVKQQSPQKSTLAIGDGANDVNMITSADVGIGIMGNEGQQAARASDYVISQFSFLRRLLFVHGREAYRKNSFAVSYILWKNFLFVTPIIFLGASSYFSGQTVYDPFLDTLYNILFTAYPIGWFATYDKEINYDLLESSPALYLIGFHNKLFNVYIFWRWYLYAVTAGLIIYWNNINVLSYLIKDSKSEMLDIWSLGSSMYTCIVFVVNLKIMMSTNTHNLFSIFLLLFSTSSYLITLFVSSKIPQTQVTGQWESFMYSLIYLGAIVHIITACVLCEYAWRTIHFILEKYLIKSYKVPVTKKRAESEVVKYLEDDTTMMQRGFAVTINEKSSINNIYKPKDYEDITSSPLSSDKELDKSMTNSDVSSQLEHVRRKFDTQVNKVKETDQTIIMDKNRRYTGFAFGEDVANVNILNERIKENFWDIKITNKNNK